MFVFLNGIIDEITPTGIIMDVSGVGYELICPASTLDKLKTGKKHKIFTYTHTNVRDGSSSLYGFLSIEDKHMFERLISISGIGPKIAVSLLSTISVADIAMAIITDDPAMLARAQGLSKKTAARIILELKEKISDNDIPVISDMSQGGSGVNAAKEAAMALAGLGYSPAEASKMIASVKDAGSVEEIIMGALKQMK